MQEILEHPSVIICEEMKKLHLMPADYEGRVMKNIDNPQWIGILSPANPPVRVVKFLCFRWTVRQRRRFIGTISLLKENLWECDVYGKDHDEQITQLLVALKKRCNVSFDTQRVKEQDLEEYYSYESRYF